MFTLFLSSFAVLFGRIPTTFWRFIFKRRSARVKPLVAKSTSPSRRGPNQTSILCSVIGFQAHRPAGQCAAEEERLAVEFDCPLGAHAPRAHLRVIQILRRALVFSLRNAVKLTRAAHQKRFMWPLIVKTLPPHIHCCLIGLA